MGGTTLLYNDVLLKNCETKRFDQSVEYDESGTDMLFSRFTLRVSGSLHADRYHPYGVFYGPTAPATAVDVTRLVQNQLSQPRAHFEYSVGGQVLLAANAISTSAFLDVNNGPKPRVLGITRVVGKNLFEVEFEIEVCRVYCPATSNSFPTYGGKRNAAVLNNRWSVSEDRDKDFYSIRTLEGTLRVSHISSFPHLYRYLCVPPLQRGYRRESMRFVDSPDGLTLKYQVVDRQKYAAPPLPATDWEATYTESSGLGAAISFGEVNVRLTGSIGTPKSELIEVAAAVIQSRLGNLSKTYKAAGDGDHSVLLQHAAIVEHLHENVVHATARVQHTSGARRWLNTRIAQMGTPLPIAGYNPEIWPSPKLFDGSSPIGVFAKYLQSPCVDIHGLVQVSNSVPDEDDPGSDDQSQGTVQVFASSEPLTPDDDTGPSDEQRTGGFPYTYCMVETQYDSQDGYMQLPIARWGGSSVPGAPQPSCVLIPIHAPIGKRSLVVHAERIGKHPELPDPFTIGIDGNGIVQVRLGQNLLLEAPELLADGKTRIFKAQYRTKHALERSPEATEIFSAGASPIDESQPQDNRVDGSSTFVAGLYE